MSSIRAYQRVPVYVDGRDEFRSILRGRTFPGLNLEFGVHSGWSINLCADIRSDLQFWGFDSFFGLPEEDNWGGTVVEKGRFSLDGNPPEVRKNVKLVTGLFADALPGWWAKHKGQISFLHLDADLYSSTIYVLKQLNDGIVPGTVIRFDELSDWKFLQTGTRQPPGSDYSNWEEGGEWKALNEWLDDCQRAVTPIGRNDRYSSIVQVTT